MRSYSCTHCFLNNQNETMQLHAPLFFGDLNGNAKPLLLTRLGCQLAKWLWNIKIMLFKYLYWRSNTILPLCLNMKANPYNGTKNVVVRQLPSMGIKRVRIGRCLHDRIEIKWERFRLQVHMQPSVYNVKRSVVDNKPSALLSRCLISWAAYGILGRSKRGWGRSQYLVLVFMLACSLCLIP